MRETAVSWPDNDQKVYFLIISSFYFSSRQCLQMSELLKWNYLPELRSVKFKYASSFCWVLTLFADVYQHGQLTELVLSNPSSMTGDKHIVTAKELHQWFLMSTKCVSFRPNLCEHNYTAKPDIIKALLTEYKTVFDARCVWKGFGSFDIFIHYPKKWISHNISSMNDQIETSVRLSFVFKKNIEQFICLKFDSSSSSSSLLFEDELWDRCDDEIRLDLHGWTSQLEIAQ